MVPYVLFVTWAVVAWLFQDHQQSLTIPSDFWRALGGDALFYQMHTHFDVHLYPLFELSLIFRGLLVYWVSAHILRDPKARTALLYSMVACVFYLTTTSILGRYVYGQVRVTGFFSHTNVLNSFLSIVGAAIAPFVFERQKPAASFLCATAIVCCMLVILLTVSRSSLAAYVLALGIVALFGLGRFGSTRNVLLVAVAAMFSILMLLKAADTLLERFANETYTASMDERRTYIAAAQLMAKDYFMGVGLGNFSALSWVKYGAMAGSHPGALVHNIWYLNMAELGYIGVGLFAMIWIRFYQFSIQTFFSGRLRRNPNLYAWMLAILAAMLPLHMQNFFHHASRFVSIYILTHILMGLAAAIYEMQMEERLRDSVGAKRLRYQANPVPVTS
jgi:hypothetical protein